LRTTSLENGVDIDAQHVLEKVAVAFFEPKLVVMNHEETIHGGII
jgi:hypothetical protein